MKELNEILADIDDGTRKIYKDKDGKSYTTLHVSRLHQWYGALERAMQASQDSDEVREALAAAKGTTATLLEAAENREKRIKELTSKVSSVEKVSKQEKERLEKELLKVKALQGAATLKLQEAQETKEMTSKALDQARAGLAQPASKFDPETALEAQAQMQQLEGDLRLLNDHIASARAEASEANSRFDKLSKEKAAQDRELAQARADLATFNKKLDIAKTANWDLFQKEDLNPTDLRLALGQKAYNKLQEVLAIEVHDVRGRVQRLQGFFAVFAKSVDKKFTPMVDVLKHAVSALRQASAKWAVTLAPWVNIILKDIVTLSLRPVSYYRQELEIRVQGQPPASPADKGKAPEGPEPDKRPSWLEVLRDRARRLVATASLVNTRARGAMARLRSIAQGTKVTVQARAHQASVALRAAPARIGSALRRLGSRIAVASGLFFVGLGLRRRAPPDEDGVNNTIVMFDAENLD